MAHGWMPTKEAAVRFSKVGILQNLAAIDGDPLARARVLTLEAGFRAKIGAHIAQLTHAGAPFAKFATNPFVLMIFAAKNQYQRISQIESDILPAKLFSSMETSAGRMIEEVVRPVYGWVSAASSMHTSDSALDAVRMNGTELQAATLKSGPRCLNDEMSENFADAVIAHGKTWVQSRAAQDLDFTYGVLYGTKRQSNKKDWHILRNLHDKIGNDHFHVTPEGRWECEFDLHGHRVRATVRVGKDFWDYFGGPNCLTEVMVALIRSSVLPGASDPPTHPYVIGDLGSIVVMPPGQQNYNVALLQNSQLPWLFLMMRHYCDLMI